MSIKSRSPLTRGAPLRPRRPIWQLCGQRCFPAAWRLDTFWNHLHKNQNFNYSCYYTYTLRASLYCIYVFLRIIRLTTKVKFCTGIVYTKVHLCTNFRLVSCINKTTTTTNVLRGHFYRASLYCKWIKNQFVARKITKIVQSFISWNYLNMI